MNRIDGPVPSKIDVEIMTEMPDDLPDVTEAFVAVAEGIDIAIVSCFKDVAYNVAMTVFGGVDFSVYQAVPQGRQPTPLTDLFTGLAKKGYNICYVKEYKLVERDRPQDQDSQEGTPPLEE